MSYQRKTRDVFIIMSNYGYGWEEEDCNETLKEARENLKAYRENGGGSYYLKKKREKNRGGAIMASIKLSPEAIREIFKEHEQNDTAAQAEAEAEEIRLSLARLRLHKAERAEAETRTKEAARQQQKSRDKAATIITLLIGLAGVVVSAGILIFVLLNG